MQEKIGAASKGKHFLASVALAAWAAVLATTPAKAAVVYDLAGFPFTFNNATDVHATLETSTMGLFTTELEIENFFNQGTYSVIMNNGSTRLVDMHNGNSTWDLQFGGQSGGVGAVLSSSPREVTLDFSTPNEITGAVLILRGDDPQYPQYLQYSQDNNISDFNFVNVDYNAVHDAYATVPYDAPFTFVPVPEPSTWAVLCVGLGALVMLRRKG